LGTRRWRERALWVRARRAAAVTGCGGNCGHCPRRTDDISWSIAHTTTVRRIPRRSVNREGVDRLMGPSDYKSEPRRVKRSDPSPAAGQSRQGADGHAAESGAVAVTRSCRRTAWTGRRFPLAVSGDRSRGCTCGRVDLPFSPKVGSAYSDHDLSSGRSSAIQPPPSTGDHW